MTRQNWCGDWVDAWEADHQAPPQSIEVHVPEGDEPTGLLDANGNPLKRQRHPLGFQFRKET